jgi:RNase P subunit RPR2
MAEEKPKESLYDLVKRLAETANPPIPAEQARAIVKAVQSEQQRAAATTNTVDNQQANIWLAEHWKSRECPVCKENDWGMAPTFAHIPMSFLGRYSAVRSFPCVVLTCRNCGNTLFFNAVAMKLLPEGAE